MSSNMHTLPVLGPCKVFGEAVIPGQSILESLSEIKVSFLFCERAGILDRRHLAVVVGFTSETALRKQSQYSRTWMHS